MDNMNNRVIVGFVTGLRYGNYEYTFGSNGLSGAFDPCRMLETKEDAIEYLKKFDSKRETFIRTIYRRV